MRDADAAKERLLSDNAALRQRVADLEAAEATRLQVEERLQHHNALLQSISQIQSEFIVEADPRLSFDRLLRTLLPLTHSEYGFIGEIRRRGAGELYLKTDAITDAAWDPDSQAFSTRHAPDGLEFHNAQTLCGVVLATGEPFIANDLSTNPRRSDLPAGAPSLRAFLGMPVIYQGSMIGMVGLANRPDGYDAALIALLQPALLTCGAIFGVQRQRQRRAQAAAALRESEQRYRQLVDSSQGLICAHDLAGDVLSINPAAAQTLGDEPQALVGRNLRTFLADSTRHLFDTYLERMRRDGTARGLMRVATTTGDERVLTYHNRLIEDAGKAPYVLGHAQDITEHRRIEEALRQSEAQFRALAEGSLQGICIDRDFKPLFMNQACADIFGYETPDELLRMDTLLPLFPPEQWEPLQRARRARLRGEPVPNQYEMQAVRKDGARLWLDVKVQVMQWDGAPAVQVTFFDITRRKLLEDQLRQSQKMEAIGALAGGIAHEFNNMLAAILGFTQLASAKAPAESPVSQHLRAVQSAGERAKDLVQQLLTFSHPSSNQQEPVIIAPVIQEALNRIRASLPATIEMRQNIAPESGAVLANAAQLCQVLMNLCANAAYAMRQTGGILEVSVDNIDVNGAGAPVHPDLQPGTYVRVRVRDTGGGIPADAIGRIFDPFFTTKAVGEGAGMGLAMAYGIVRAHGGVIHAESAPESGAIFTIYLPRLPETPLETPQTSTYQPE